MAKYIIDVPDEAVGFMDGEMSFFVEPKIKDERRRHYVLRIDEEDVSIYTELEDKDIENNKVYLCNSCKYNYPDCPLDGKGGLRFGDAVGHDNICCCSVYEPKNLNEDEAWKFMRKMATMESQEIRECYKEDYWSDIFEKYTYSEAKAKYEAWKKSKEEIRVGDELINHLGRPYIIYHIDRGSAYGIDVSRGYPLSQEVFPTKNYIPNKTGRYFPEIAELIKKMRGEEK